MLQCRHIGLLFLCSCYFITIICITVALDWGSILHGTDISCPEDFTYSIAKADKAGEEAGKDEAYKQNDYSDA